MMMLLTVSSVSAQSRKTKPRPGAAITATQELSPEAAAMREAQKSWPGRSLCDDGGYRIRPCDIGFGGGN
jgi:hypothetical protein